MKILDRYVLQTFLVSLLIVLAATMGLVLILDLFINIGRFMSLVDESQKAGFWTVLADLCDYYFYRAFFYFQMILAPSVLVAAAASMVRLNRGRELLSIKAAGISLYRVLWPMIVVALVLDGFYIFNQEVLIPGMAVQIARDPKDLNIPQNFPVNFIRDDNNNILYAPDYDPKTHEMLSQTKILADKAYSFPARVRIFLRDSRYQARGTIEADRAAWDARGHGWRLTNGLRLPPLKEAADLEHVPIGPEGDRVDFYASNVGPDEIQRHRANELHRYMSYGELKSMAEEPMRGNRRQLQVAMHQHVTGPLLNLLLLLLGLPFVAGRDDQNYFVSIGVAMAMVIGVFVLTFAATAFGNAGHIGPLWAAWLPVFIVLPSSILSMEALRT